jgi:nondiscriminating glutamyl-tRNA synthetase
MANKSIRVRFAPAPTGMMHLGNIRTALINYLFARQKKGTFVLRIEDTDQNRNYDPQALAIQEDLHWLSLVFDEGPGKDGGYGPYFQSQRTPIYQQKLTYLIEEKKVYRCFCTEDELEKKRERQRALKLPPRYDRTCTKLNESAVAELLNRKMPFVWRFKIDHDATAIIQDISHGNVRFELQHFSDFPLTRQDESFTFIFANFVDDMTMAISHVFRGEDHLSNTANQAALYMAFNVPLPIFWHMPILCNTEGKKLSKRDFGFSLRDLKNGGYLPEAICNYLGILGGSFDQEIMSLEELVDTINFDNQHAAGQIKYDLEKLRWMNHKWLMRIDSKQLVDRCKPFIQKTYPQAVDLSDETLSMLIKNIKTDLVTTQDVVTALAFYFNAPALKATDIQACISPSHYQNLAVLIKANLNLLQEPNEFVTQVKTAAQKSAIPTKELFWFLRLAFMGSTHGPALHELITMLGKEQATERLEQAINLLKTL